jgi:hypothetical protein
MGWMPTLVGMTRLNYLIPAQKCGKIAWFSKKTTKSRKNRLDSVEKRAEIG